MAKIRFSPTIIEHAAFLTGQTPSKAAQSAALMAQAHIEAFRRYRTNSVTVGIDVYNIEAEALGCHVRFYDDASIPGIISHPYTLENDPGKVMFSSDLGRIQMVLEAASEVFRAVDGEINVNVGICGPFSILIELMGFESAVQAFYDEDERVGHLLDALLTFQKDYCGAITARGLGVTVFESWASPPLINPEIYKTYAAPYERALFDHLTGLGLTTLPLVIGGDTRAIVDDILATGTTLLVSDYNTPLHLYAEKARAHNTALRANIDPKLVRNGAWDTIRARIHEIRTQAERYPRIIAGTGVIPYDTPPEYLLRVIEMLEEA